MAEIVSQYRIEVKQAVDALNQVAQATDSSAKKSEDLGKKTEQAGQKAVKASSNFANLGKQILTAFGVVGVVTTFISAIKNAVNAASDFEAQMSKVRAISGATDAEMVRLTKSAQSLGASTRYTATQVGTLQEEYARLGFSTKEILAATEATLNLATATGSTLAEAAEVTGATIRGFGLDASEATRVTDVMALSFSISALNMERFRESMKLIAPIARASNIPLETTTALLGQLANAGVSGSLAGTALKNLMTKLADESSNLSQKLGFSVKNTEDLFKAFKILAQDSLTLTQGLELTDERAVAAFVTLTEGIDTVEEFDAALLKATGTTDKMAAQMEDNFKGAVTQLSSAWEGLTNKIMGSNGALRSFVELLTDSIRGWGMILDLLGNGTLETIRMQDEYSKRTKELIKLEDNMFSRRVAAAKENDTTEQLAAEMKDELFKKSERQFKVEQKLAEAEKDLQKAVKEKADAVSRSFGFDKQSVIAAQNKIEASNKLIIELESEAKVLEHVTGKMRAYIGASEKVADGSDEATESAVRSIATLSEELKTLKEQFESATIGSEGYFKAASAIEAKTKELARALLDARMSLIDIEQPVLMAVKAVDQLAGDSIKSLSAQLAEAKKRKEEAFEFTPEFNQAIKDIDRLEQRIKDFGQTTIEVGAEVKSTVTEDVAKSTAEMQQAQQNALDVMQAGLSTLGNIYGSIAQMAEQTTRYELQLLRDRFDDGEITREEYYAKEKQLQRESAQRAKDAATFQAILGAAQAALNALSTPGVPFPIALAFSLFAAAQAAVQVAAIQSAPIPRFEQGGPIKGKRHYQGGEFIEAEAGEYVVNRKATAKNYELIEAINKGMGEAYIMQKWVAPAVDAALLNGWQDVGRSAELNGLTATLKDHNIIRAMDRNREATTYGLTMVAGELKRLKSNNARKAW